MTESTLWFKNLYFPVLAQEIEGGKTHSHQHIHPARVPTSPSWGTPAPAPQGALPGWLCSLDQLWTGLSRDDSIIPDQFSPVWSWAINALLREKSFTSFSSQFNAFVTSSLATDHSSSPLHLNPATCARKAVPTDSLIRTSNDSLN